MERAGRKSRTRIRGYDDSAGKYASNTDTGDGPPNDQSFTRWSDAAYERTQFEYPDGSQKRPFDLDGVRQTSSDEMLKKHYTECLVYAPKSRLK